MGGGFGVGPKFFESTPGQNFLPKVAKRFIVTYIIANSEIKNRDENTLHPPPLIQIFVKKKFEILKYHQALKLRYYHY